MQGDGVFVDCRSHWKGRIGTAAVSFSKYQGGAVHIGSDGPDQRLGLAHTALQMAARLRLTCTSEAGATDHGHSVLIRQENDPAPKFHFLEEGAVRLGMRVAFDLLDDAGHYHGDGRIDLWTYPEGDIHITYNMQLVDQVAHSHIHDAYLEIHGADTYRQIRLGSQELSQGGTAEISIGANLPDKRIVLSGDDGHAALYWARDEGHVWAMGSDHGPTPPFYASRWPTGMQQWARDGMGWTCNGDSAGVCAHLTEAGPAMRLAWLEDENLPATTTLTAMLIISLTDDLEELERRIQAVQQPLVPTVDGGTFRCYTEEDGTYEVGQADPTGVSVTFPPDPLERQVHLRYFRRKTDRRHCGGVRATANGQPLRPQLMSEGELVDDVCVPMDMSHRNHSVDDVFVATRLDAKKPTEIVIDKVPGIQATYQSEIAGLDLQRRAGNKRDIAIWSSRNKERPILELDLFSNAVHRLTAYNQTDPVVWEMPMAWFASCGISKHQYCNYIKEFSIEQNDPEAVEIYTRSTNPNQRSQSEMWLRVPYDHPRPRMEVRMRMHVLEQWDEANVEFTDIFPYPSRLPETWFHDAVLFMQKDHSFVKHSYRPELSAGHGAINQDDKLYYALYPSDRGNVLTLIKNLNYGKNDMHYSVCGNYIDIHVNLHPGEAPVAAGSTFEIEYVCEVYGDGGATVDELGEIGRRALEEGDIVID